MAEIKRTALAITLLLIVSISSHAQNVTTVDEKTSTYLKTFRESYSKALLENNPEGITSFYANDIRLMPAVQLTMMTKVNAEAYHRAFLSRFTVKEYMREAIEILNLGSRIVEFGLFSMNIALKKTGETFTLKGKYGNIWERSADGKLMLITESWNYNHAVNIGDLLRFNEVPAVNIALQSHVPVNTSLSFDLAAFNHYQEMVITEGNAKIWSQFYTDDYMMLTSNHPVVKGRKDIDTWLDVHAKELPVFEKLDIRTDRIDDLGAYVIEYASHIAIVRNGDWSGVSTGKDYRIWRREKNGSLRIFRGMGMYDH